MLRLYTTPLSANGRKVLAACELLGLDVHVEEVNVYRGEGRDPAFLAINPSGKIPVLVDEGLTLTESNAILQHLDEAHGDRRLSSKEPHTRAAIAQWMFWESAHWQPALIAVMTPIVGHLLRPDAVPAPEAPPNWNDARLRPLLDRLEQHLEGRDTLVGDTLTLADLSVAGMMTYFRAAKFPFSDFRALARWHARLEAVPAWDHTLVEPWRV